MEYLPRFEGRQAAHQEQLTELRHERMARPRTTDGQLSAPARIHPQREMGAEVLIVLTEWIAPSLRVPQTADATAPQNVQS